MQPIPQPKEDFNTYLKGVFPAATLPLPIVSAPRMFSPPPNADIKLILPSDPAHDLNRALINHNTAPEDKGNSSEIIIKSHSKKNLPSQYPQANTRQMTLHSSRLLPKHSHVLAKHGDHFCSSLEKEQ